MGDQLVSRLKEKLVLVPKKRHCGAKKHHLSVCIASMLIVALALPMSKEGH